MAAPLPAFIQLPDDSGNTGNKVRTQTRVVGANTVDEHFFVPIREAKVVSHYRLALVQSTVLASAQNGTTAGFLFGHQPSTATTRAMRLRAMWFDSQSSTALATPTAPRLLARRYTSAGALSGALIAPNLLDSSLDAAPTCLFSLANTGTTVVHVGIGFASGGIMGAVTAVGAYAPAVIQLVDPSTDEDEWMVFRPGEGFVVFQDTAGTTSDTRKFNLQIFCDEIDIS